jgi:hypothetical protein
MTRDDIDQIDYFWRNKDDLERWSEWETKKEAIAVECPELIQAWEAYKSAIRNMTAVVESLENKTHE